LVPLSKMILNSKSESTLTYSIEEVLAVVKADAIRRNLMDANCSVYLRADTGIRTGTAIREATAVLTTVKEQGAEIPVNDPTRAINTSQDVIPPVTRTDVESANRP